jgi:hypothetical protein
MSENIIVTLAGAVASLAIFSLLYRENIFYRIAEHMYIGLGIGYILFQGFDRLIAYVWIPVTTKGEYFWLIPFIFGILVFTRFIPGYSWISKWPMSLVIGSGTGLAMGGLVAVMIVGLIVQTITLDFSNLSNILFLLITTATIIYFILTREHTGVLGYMAKFGRIALMGAFGGAMASNVNSFTSRLGGVIQILVTYPGYYVTVLAIILVALDALVLNKK